MGRRKRVTISAVLALHICFSYGNGFAGGGGAGSSPTNHALAGQTSPIAKLKSLIEENPEKVAFVVEKTVTAIRIISTILLNAGTHMTLITLPGQEDTIPSLMFGVPAGAGAPG